VSYVRRHLAKTLLTLLGVVVGVATFSAIKVAQTALLSGIRGTVDRMAGKAQLQITNEGGVPEELYEKARELPGVKALAPVIEQIVVPERGELGSTLVLGVDLLGDREMRDYGFEGDADLDDPLLFLAQADSIALARPLAERAGLKVGDTFTFRAPEGPKKVVVRGLLSPKGFAETFGGNLAVMDVYAAQTLFGRGRRFDRLEVRLTEETSLEAGTATLRAVVGEAYQVETPARRSAQLEQLISSFVAGFNITSGFALGIGTFLILNAFTVAVNRRRRDIGTLRALGATPGQVRALFLFEAVVIGAVGGVIGILAGQTLSQAALRLMGDTTERIYGWKDTSQAFLTLPLVAQGIGMGVLASLVGAFQPANAAARVVPTEALAKGSFSARSTPFSLARVALGGGLCGAALLLAVVQPLTGYPLVAATFLSGILGAVLVAGPSARFLIASASPVVARLAPVSGRLAVDSLLSNPRRTSGTVAAIMVSLSFVLGFGGYMASANAAIRSWMDDILTSDLYVRASTNLVKPDFRFPASLRQELLTVPGVRAVESFRAFRFVYQGDLVTLSTIEMGPTLDRTEHDFLQGDEASMRRGLVEERKCAVSDNFYRRYRKGVGDTVEIPSPNGTARIPIAAVVRDYSNDKGSILLDRSVFLDLWNDDRVDTYDVNLAAGADAATVRTAIREKLAGRFPALVSTRKEFIGEIQQAVDAFYALMQITVFLALIVAFLGIVTSLLITVADRTREIGILKALGALAPQIGRSVVVEALAVASIGLLLALPIGAAISRFMGVTVAEVFAGWRMVWQTPWATIVQLVVALPIVSAVAAFVPARQAARVKVSEAIGYE